VRHRANVRADRSSHCSDMAVFFGFQDGGRPPSWICYTPFWTTHEEYLVVFVTVQNLVGIIVVVSITQVLIF